MIKRRKNPFSFSFFVGGFIFGLVLFDFEILIVNRK